MSGVCRECGCTDDRACVDADTGLPCSWANAEQTVCSVCAIREAEEMLNPATDPHNLIPALALALGGLGR